MKFFEKTVTSETIFEGQIVTVKKDTVELSENNEVVYRELVEHSGGVCVAAMTSENKYILVSQYRYGIQDQTLEFIAGKLEPNENPLIAIQRELLEESGYIAHDWTDWGEFYVSPAYLSEKIHLFHAKNLTFKQTNLDENEFLEVVELSLDEIIEKIESQEIKDLKTIALVYKILANKKGIV